jgi:hypothetical protein
MRPGLLGFINFQSFYLYRYLVKLILDELELATDLLQEKPDQL